MDAKTQEHFRNRLLKRLEELRRTEEETAQDRAPVALDQQSVGRLSRMDAMQMQAMAEAQSRRRMGERRRIEAALKRMDEDEYGYCVKCGEAIASRRLELDPTVTRCIDCAA